MLTRQSRGPSSAMHGSAPPHSGAARGRPLRRRLAAESGEQPGLFSFNSARAVPPAAARAPTTPSIPSTTQGPRLERLELDGDSLHVSTSPVHAIPLGGAGNRWLDGSSVFDECGGQVSAASFDVSPFRGSFCRVTVIDGDGRRAWSNPIWL